MNSNIMQTKKDFLNGVKLLGGSMFFFVASVALGSTHNFPNVIDSTLFVVAIISAVTALAGFCLTIHELGNYMEARRKAR